jgi:hypothetical protein
MKIQRIVGHSPFASRPVATGAVLLRWLHPSRQRPLKAAYGAEVVTPYVVWIGRPSTKGTALY